jgi:hypothetical protein
LFVWGSCVAIVSVFLDLVFPTSVQVVLAVREASPHLAHFMGLLNVDAGGWNVPPQHLDDEIYG